MNFEKEDIFTGLFTLGGIVLTIATILILLGYNLFESNKYYIIRMAQTAGVKKGTPIKIEDFTIGEITKVEPIFGSNIYFKATAKIDSHFTLYRGTKVNITKENVIGDTILRIYPPHTREDKLKEGDTLFATNILNLDKMVESLSQTIQNVNTIIKTVTQLAGSSRGNIQVLLANLTSSMMKVNQIIGASQMEIVETFRNVRKTSTILRQFAREIKENPWKVLAKPSAKHQSALP